MVSVMEKTMKKTGRKMALLLAAAMLLNPLAELQVKASQEEVSHRFGVAGDILEGSVSQSSCKVEI